MLPLSLDHTSPRQKRLPQTPVFYLSPPPPTSLAHVDLQLLFILSVVLLHVFQPPCRHGHSESNERAQRSEDQNSCWSATTDTLLADVALVMSVVELDLDLLTSATAQISRLERIQNEVVRAVLGFTRDTSITSMRYVLDMPRTKIRHKYTQVKTFL